MVQTVDMTARLYKHLTTRTCIQKIIC